jgi:hypothetical protein
MPATRAWVGGIVAACVLATVGACGGDGDEGRPASAGDGGEVVPSAAVARGTMVEADTLANTRIGGPYGTVLAFRFQSGWTGVVRAVRFYAVLNGHGREGYAGGTGGTLQVTLAADSGGPRHVPTGDVLASATYKAPTRDSWPLVRFDKPADVVAGRYYHVVFTNTDPQPATNYISVNSLLAFDGGPRSSPLPHGMAVFLGATNDGGRTPARWMPRAEDRSDRYAPVLDVVGDSEDQHLGLGYMEVWSSNPKPIGGDEKVRQLLGPASREVVTGAWLRVRQRVGATAPLELRIERAGGGVLAAGTRRPRTVTPRPRWVHVRFRRPAEVDAGEDIALTATASEPDAYDAFPIREGTEFGFDPRTVFSGGYAQFTDNGSWVGWDQWGGHDLKTGVLQFRLDVAGGGS